MNDDILAHLREARALCKDEEQETITKEGSSFGNFSKRSRELALVITKIDEAILWRQEDLRLKQPPINETNRV